MKSTLVIATALLAMTALPSTTFAQGIPGGAAHGVAVGSQAAGPVGAVVGGVVGGAIGGVEGLLGVDNRGYQQAYAAPPPAYEPGPPVRRMRVGRRYGPRHAYRIERRHRPHHAHVRRWRRPQG